MLVCVLCVPSDEPKPPGPVMQEDLWDGDMDLHQMLLRTWEEIRESSRHE